METRLHAVETLLAAQASLNEQLLNSGTPTAAPGDEHSEQRGRRDSISESSRSKRKREHSRSSSSAPDSRSSSGEMFVNVRHGHLEDDTPAPDTVLDGMGALSLGDEDDYGYFGKTLIELLARLER